MALGRQNDASGGGMASRGPVALAWTTSAMIQEAHLAISDPLAQAWTAR